MTMDHIIEYNNNGNLLASQGRFEEAEAMFRKAIDLRPDIVGLYRNLVACKKYGSVDDKDIAVIEKLIATPNCPEPAIMELSFALGKIYDDCDIYDKAMIHYQKGNELKNKDIPFDEALLVDYIDRTIATFDKSFFDKLQNIGSSSTLPVFIVGMPRSGKSLVENIISRHKEISAAGELPAISQITAKLRGEDGIYPECVTDITADTALSLAKSYLQILGTNTKHIVDTMPSNYLHFGLIHCLLPNAKIIHCHRDPMDNCLFAYFRYFENDNLYTYDTKNFAVAYREYQRLMSHWNDVLPMASIDLKYEDLVANTEEKTRELIEFLELDWDDNCLLPEPLHNNEIGRSQHYQSCLKPMLEL